MIWSRNMTRAYQTTRGHQVTSLPSHAVTSYDEPPFEYRGGWLVHIPLFTTPEVVDALIPHPLKAPGDGCILLSINRLEAIGLGKYHEVVLSIPCHFDLGTPDGLVGPAKPRSRLVGEYATYHPAFGCVPTIEPSERVLRGQYVVVIYVDKDTPIAVGREVWGFPKKGAQIFFEEKAGVITARVTREGIPLIRATFTLAREGSPAELQDVNWQFDTWFNLKLIPSVQGGLQHPDVAQLTCTTLQNLSVKHVYQGHATVEFSTSPTAPLHTIPVRQVEPGFYVQADGDLTYGRVLHDYLAR
jgi:acetoacetate decarboxylase